MKEHRWEECGMWDEVRMCFGCLTGCRGSRYEPCFRPMGMILVWDEEEE